jgi:hypothetical protein
VNSKTTGWQYTMSNVRKWDGEGTFAGSRGNDGVAPVPAVRRAGSIRQSTTHCNHSKLAEADIQVEDRDS